MTYLNYFHWQRRQESNLRYQSQSLVPLPLGHASVLPVYSQQSTGLSRSSNYLIPTPLAGVEPAAPHNQRCPWLRDIAGLFPAVSCLSSVSTFVPGFRLVRLPEIYWHGFLRYHTWCCLLCAAAGSQTPTAMIWVLCLYGIQEWTLLRSNDDIVLLCLLRFYSLRRIIVEISL